MFDSSRIHAVINASVGSAKEKGKYLRAFPGLSERITFNTRDSRAGFFDNMKSNYEEWCLKCVNRSRAVCDQPFFYLPVFADGSVRFCSADWTGESCMGNVKDSTIQEIFYSEKMAYSAGRMAGLQFDYDFCRNCYSEIGLGT